MRGRETEETDRDETDALRSRGLGRRLKRRCDGLKAELGAEFFRELRDDEVVAAADAAIEVRGWKSGEVAHADPVAFGAVGSLGDAVEVDEIVEFFGRALEDHAVDGVAVEREEEKHFARDFEDEAVTPLLHNGGVGKGQGEGLEVGEAQVGKRRAKVSVKLGG